MIKIKFLAFLLMLNIGVFSQGCKTEKLLSDEWDPAILNGPIGIAIVPGTDLALVTNSNYVLNYRTGALSVIDLATNEILSDETIELPNFSGQVSIDNTRGRVLIPNRLNNSLVVFDYQVPGTDGLAISFTEPELSGGIEGYKNQILLDEDPFGIIITNHAVLTSKTLVTNITDGTVSVLSSDDLNVIDADPDHSDRAGIPLVTAINRGSTDNYDGIGANRMVVASDNRLVFTTSTLSNYIFIIDTLDNEVEGIFDLHKYSAALGTRGIALTSDDKLFVAHRSMGGILVFDVSGVTDNGINNEIISEDFITFIPTGVGAEGIALDNAETKLYVCNGLESSVTVIDIATLTPVGSISTERGPTEIAVHPTTDVGYVTNFQSDSITVFDTITDKVTGVIK